MCYKNITAIYYSLVLVNECSFKNMLKPKKYSKKLFLAQQKKLLHCVSYYIVENLF